MEDQQLDIFESDIQFIEFSSSVLLGIGLVMLPIGLGCKIFEWGLCDLQLLPLFGGETRFRSDLSAINLPLAMLILGIASRMYTRFGWIICNMLLVLLTGFFGFMAYFLRSSWAERIAMSGPSELPQGGSLYIESMILNGALAIFCLAGLIFLWMPSVRKLYWQGPRSLSSPSIGAE